MSNIAYLKEEREKIAAGLPSSYATRWNASRKAAVVRAVQAGVITHDKALERYRLSRTEFQRWQDHLANEGEQGLTAKRLIDQR